MSSPCRAHEKAENLDMPQSTFSLLICQLRVQFKLLLFIYKSPYNQNPSYIKDLLSLKPVVNYALRSSGKSLLFVPKSTALYLGIGPLPMLHLFSRTHCH